MPPSPVGFSDKSNSFFHSELKGTNAMFNFLSFYKGSIKIGTGMRKKLAISFRGLNLSILIRYNLYFISFLRLL